jgi:hypothetical protein
MSRRRLGIIFGARLGEWLAGVAETTEAAAGPRGSIEGMVGTVKESAEIAGVESPLTAEPLCNST